MPSEIIPFGNNQPTAGIPGYHQTTVQTGTVMRDVYINMAGDICKRPALDLLCSTGQTLSVNGLYYWEKNQKVFAVTGGKLFVASGNSASFAEIVNTDTAFELANYQRVCWAEHSTSIYAANGGIMKNITSVSIADLDTDVDPDIPQVVESITVLDRYVLCADYTSYGTGNFYWSVVNNPSSWAGYYAEAESRPDHLYHIEARNGLLYLFGQQSGEVFYNDGVAPFTRLSQGLFPGGTIARRSPVFCEAINTFVWQDFNGNIVKLEGNQAVPFSLSLGRYFGFNAGTSNTTSARANVGHYFVWDGIPFYLLVSASDYWGGSNSDVNTPEGGFSIALNLMTGDWYEWGSYYAAGTTGVNKFLPFQCTSVCTVPNGGVYIGDMYGGKILKLARGGVDDTTYGVMSPMIRSADQMRNVAGREKICNSLSFQFKAPQSHLGGSFSIVVKYSDDGGSTWTNGRTVAASISPGQKGKIITERNWGRYYQRQWQIDFSTTSDIALGPVIEDYEIV
jgi:hypothetical protein